MAMPSPWLAGVAILGLSILKPKVAREQSQPQLIAISSPYGSTGKTTLAINLAAELAKSRRKVLLIDCDRFGPAIDAQLGLPGVTPGIAAAVRIANQDRFDLEQLERLTSEIPKLGFRVLSGTLDDNRWQGIEFAAMAKITETAKLEHDFVLLDLGSFSIASSQPAADLVKEFIAHSDKALIVALADPIGIYRLLGIEQQLLTLEANYKIVINRLRNSVLANAKAEISETFTRLSDFDVAYFLPEDSAALDQSVREAIPAVSLSRPSPYKQALAGFVRSELLAQPSRLDSRLAKLG